MRYQDDDDDAFADADMCDAVTLLVRALAVLAAIAAFGVALWFAAHYYGERIAAYLEGLA